MKLQDRHKGQPILIMGCGPSLSEEACKTIRAANMIEIGVNFCYRTIWPKYLLHVDYYWKAPNGQFSEYAKMALNQLIGNGMQMFAPLDHDLNPTTDIPHYPFYSDNGATFTTSYKEGNGPLRLGHSSTSIFHALQLATIMGGNPVILIGVDFYIEENTEGVGKLHCYDHENKIDPQAIAGLNKRLEKFDLDLKNKAVPALNEKGVKVLNASPKSKVTAFEKTTLEEALKWQ
jgi:hypothetical protein